MHIRLAERVLKRMTDTELEIIGYERTRIRGLDAASVSLVPLIRVEIDDVRAAMERIDADRVRGDEDSHRGHRPVGEGGGGRERGRGQGQDPQAVRRPPGRVFPHGPRPPHLPSAGRPMASLLHQLHRLQF